MDFLQYLRAVFILLQLIIMSCLTWVTSLGSLRALCMQKSTGTNVDRWASRELSGHHSQIMIVKGSSDLGLKLLDSLPLIWTPWSFQQGWLSCFQRSNKTALSSWKGKHTDACITFVSLWDILAAGTQRTTINPTVHKHLIPGMQCVWVPLPCFSY